MIRHFEGMATVLYARVSTDDHEQNADSQLVALSRVAKELGMDIVGKYKDDSTGGNLNRSGFEEMMGRIMVHEDVSIIFCLDADRFSRDMVDKTKMLGKLKKAGVVIRYLSDLSATPETEEGMVMDNMKTYGAQKYISGHALKIKAGFERVRIEGTKSGNPIGRPAKTINRDLVLQCADNRYSVAEASKVMKVGRETLRRYLIDNDLMAEYYDRVAKAGGCNSNHKIVENAGRRYLCPKPLTPKNTAELYTNDEKTGGAS